jgi:Fe-S oxidoreductase
MLEEVQALIENMALLGCIQCGRCTGGCPVSLKTVLNVRRLIYDTVLNTMTVDTHPELWDCTTCTTCSVRCPKEVNPAELIVGLRTVLVDNGRLPPTVRDALKSIGIRGNPLNMSAEDRAVWADDLDVPRILDEPAETLLFVGCTPSYDPRIQPISRILVETFRAGGEDFCILGEEEFCCAHEARRMGEQEMFEGTVEMYEEIFEEADFQRMVAISPHCFNAFKNEYGVDFPVEHYTHIIARLIRGDKLDLKNEVNLKVTYHDPCFLGKVNGIFDEPRDILKAIPGVEFVEMDRVRERSLCCEGGGGRMWSEGTNVEDRLASERIEEAMDTGADVLAVACPFCLLTLEDAVKVGGYEDRLQVLDIMELVAKALEA